MTKKCSHPENRRGFDTGIEWCIDCQAIMDEKGNFVHQTAEATDAPQVLSASAECPLCGHEGPHPHTPLEQVIYRNGVKAGKAHGNEPLPCTFPACGHRDVTECGLTQGASRDADHCDYPDCEQHWTHVVAQARAILEPLAEHDPAIRQWLKTPDLPKLPGASRDVSQRSNRDRLA